MGCFYRSPVFGAALDLGLFFFGLPELELLTNITAISSTATTAYAAASAAGLTVVNAGIAGGLSGAVTSGRLKGALLGAAQGVAEAGVAPGISHTLGTVIANPKVDDFIANGFVGGLFNISQKGGFASGFLAAGVGSLPAPIPLDQYSNGIEMATLGGAASVLGGGKFANGAVTGAFSYAAGASYANDNDPANENGPPALPASASGCNEYCGGVGATNIANGSGGADITWTGLSQDAANYILGNHGYQAGPGKSTFFQQFSTADSLADVATYASSYGQETARGVPAGSNGYAIVATYPTAVGIDAYTGLPTNRYVVYTTPTATVNLGVVSVGVRQVTNIFPRASGQ
jgi:hypothetical protein